MNLEEKFLNQAAAEILPQLDEDNPNFRGPVPPAAQLEASTGEIVLTPDSPEAAARIAAGLSTPASIVGQNDSTESIRSLPPVTVTADRVFPEDTASIQNIPRNTLQEMMGTVGSAIQSGAEYLDFAVIGLPDVGTLTLKDLTVGDLGKVMEAMSYGFTPTTGAGETLQPTPEALDLLNAIPAFQAASKAVKYGAKGLRAGAEALAPAAADVIESGLRKTGMITDIVPDGKSMPKPEGLVSSRFPTAVKATEDPLKNNLLINLDAAKQDPKAFEHNVNLITKYPNFVSSAKTTDLKADDFINSVKDNLLFLYDAVPDATRKRSMLWYDGARNITDKWSSQYNIPDQSVAGVLAVLSPQKDWFMNVSLGERVIDIMSTKQSYKWDSAMSSKAKQIWKKEKYAPMLKAIEGKQLSEITDAGLKAMWLRTFDEAHLPREHQIVTPEGQYAGARLTSKGVPYQTGWGSLNEIGKAVNIFENPSVENVSLNLGTQHKVRSFYNNIYAPNDSSGNVTIDTHAVAAGLLRPLSGKSREVEHNFGSNVKGEVGPKNSSFTGSQGTYAIYAEAYKRAAEERGVLPRQMQSITWEAVRGLFEDTFKTPKNAEMIDNIWLQYKNGKISLEDARNEIVKSAGGITAPEWERAGLRPESTKAVQPASNEGELSRTSVSRGAAGGLVSGKRNGTSARTKRKVTATGGAE
jgi:hypothetical protein